VPTCHVVFGEATAILAGDALLTHGLGVFAAYPKDERRAAAKIRVLETVVDAIGTRGRIHENKTGRLMRASLLAGAILAGGDESALSAIDRYGSRVGLAFQIKDDLLDVESDAATLGKASNKDAAAGKATFPVVWGVERSRALLSENIAEAVAIAEALPRRGGVLPNLARFIGARKS
jgi:farnesyl diphosphate synthase